MSGETITGNSAGIRLTPPAGPNPLNVASTGFVYGVGYGVSGLGYGWTIDNQGLIFGSPHVYSIGVSLYNGGGTIINGRNVIEGSPDNTAEIFGYGYGIYVTGAQATITNYGSIEQALQARGAAIYLHHGGTVTNASGATVEGHTGIVSRGGTIVNGGTIEGTDFGSLASRFSQPGAAIVLDDAGLILNYDLVEGGIDAPGASTIFNSGSIASDTVGVLLGQGATLTNAGTIAGNTYSVEFGGGDDLLVIDTGSHFYGNFEFSARNNSLELAAPTGTISVYGFSTVTVDAGTDWTLTGTNAIATTITNLGTVSGAGNGVSLGKGGAIVNGSPTDTTASISGYYGALLSGAAATVTNYGSIAGSGPAGVAMQSGGAITNGSTGDATAVIAGQRFGADISGASGTVTNFATILAAGSGGIGIRLAAGGAVANQAGGVVSGAAYGVEIFSGGGTVSNAGRISATGGRGAAVFLAGGGSVYNATGALITATQGIVSAGNASVANSGTIIGGVFAYGTGIVTNGTGGVITGYGFGVEVGADSTITNSGKISADDGPAILTTGSYAVGVAVVNAGTISGTGGVAIDLAGGASRVVDDPGAVFKGNVVAQGSGNTLELAAGAKSGSLSGLGSSFTGFNTVALDPSANWALSGHNTLVSNAIIATDPGARLTIAGSLQAGSGLEIAGSGTIAVGSAGSLEVGTAGGAKAGSITVDAGDTLTASGTLRAAVVDQGSIVLDGTTTVTGSLAGSGSATIDPGTVLDVSGQLGLAGLSFLGGGNETLALGTPTGATSTISGFGSGDTVDLLHQAATSDTFLDNTLTVSGTHGVIVALQFSSGYSAANFALASDHHGGTTIAFVPS